MSIMICPNISNLGVTNRFWVTNFLPTTASNYHFIEKLKYSNFIVSLEFFFDHLFVNTFYDYIFKKDILLMFNHFKFNCFGFPNKQNLQNNILTLVFYYFNTNAYKKTFFDFTNQMYSVLEKWDRFIVNYREIHVQLQDKIFLALATNHKKLPKNFFQTVQPKYFTLITSLVRIFVSIRKKYVLFFKQKIKEFLVLFHSIQLQQRLLKVYHTYFPNQRLYCKVNIVFPFSQCDAKFILFLLQLRIRKGMQPLAAVNFVFRFLQNLPNIVGFRLVCGGRLHRGIKAGYVVRSFGVFTFTRTDVEKRGFVMDYAEGLVQNRTGTCGFKIWVSFNVKQDIPMGYEPGFNQEQAIDENEKSSENENEETSIQTTE